MTPAKTYTREEGLKWMIDHPGEILLSQYHCYWKYDGAFRNSSMLRSGDWELGNVWGSDTRFSHPVEPTPAEPDFANEWVLLQTVDDLDETRIRRIKEAQLIESLVDGKVEELMEHLAVAEDRIMKELTGDGRK